MKSWWTRRNVVAGTPALLAFTDAYPAPLEVTPTNTSDERGVIDRYAAAWSRGDVAAATACYHDEFTLHYFGRNVLAGDHIGKPAAIKALAEFSRRSRRHLVAVKGVLAGPQCGAIMAREALGPNGVEVDRLLLYTIKNGLLKECWVYDQDQRLVDEWIGLL